MRTRLARQEILAAFDGSGMSAARFAVMVGINYSTFCSWVQERNKKQGNDSALTGATAKSQVQRGRALDSAGKNATASAKISGLKWSTLSRVKAR